MQLLYKAHYFIDFDAPGMLYRKRERFAGPNIRSFEEDRESFSVNILHERLFNNYRYNISAPGQ